MEFLEENDTVILFYSAVSKNVESWVLNGLFKSKCKIETCMLKKQCKNGLDFYIAGKLSDTQAYNSEVYSLGTLYR